MKNLDCKHCDSVIIKSYGNEAKMRSKLIKWTSDGMFAVCKSCGHENEINQDVIKSLQSSFVYEVGQEQSTEKLKKSKKAKVPTCQIRNTV